MKRLLCLALALLFTCGAALAETAEPTLETDQGRLAGRIIGIDPGHQAHANSEKEPIAPGSSEKKAKVSSGTAGVSTRRPEYEVNLEVALQLKAALEAEGAQVVMTRETNDVDISNVERAQMCNEAGCDLVLRIHCNPKKPSWTRRFRGCDLVLRIHCNGAEKKSVNGIGLYVRKTGACAEESYAASESILPAMAEATGAKANGIYQRDTYSGLNWSEAPSILVEMGYMSNPEEDERLCDPEYQAKLVSGMTEGVCAYFESLEQ